MKHPARLLLVVFLGAGSVLAASDATPNCDAIWNDKVQAKCEFQKEIPLTHPYMDSYREWKAKMDFDASGEGTANNHDPIFNPEFLNQLKILQLLEKIGW